MSKTVKKIADKIQRKPKARLLVENESFFAKLPNVEFRITRNHVDIEKAEPIVCPSCGAKHNRKWIKEKVNTVGLSQRTVLVDRMGKQNASLVEFYAKAEKGEMSPREFFEGESRIRKMYADIPMNEQPISSTNKSMAITCRACDYKLGLIEVSAEATPQRPTPPDADTIIHLPKTPLEDRWVREKFHISEGELDNWLKGKDKETVDKMEDLTEFEKKIRDFPYIRETGKQISNLKSATHLTIEKMREEIRTRGGRLYNLFAAPPAIINAQIARINKIKVEGESLSDEQKKTEFSKIAGLTHVSPKLIKDLMTRGKLFPGHGVKPKEKTAREKEMEELGGKPIRR